MLKSTYGLCAVALIITLAGCDLVNRGNTPAVNTPTALPSPTATANPTPTPTGLYYTPFAPLLAEVVLAGPVYVTGDQKVPGAALQAASAMLATMLRHRPDVVMTLQRYGTLTAVFARTETACDLPYLAQYRGSNLCATWVGGSGGTLAIPVTTCDEKNLLKEPDDPYGRGSQPYSENVCVHELAHTVMNVGLTQTDRDQIHARYIAAKNAGLWTGDYAMTDDMEFFAVMTEFYFGAGPAIAVPAHPYSINGPAALKQFDPTTFALIDSIYQGSADLR